MARKKVVTRTMKMTRCDVVCLDTAKETTFHMVLDMAGTYSNAETLEKAIRSLIDNEVRRFCYVDNCDTLSIYCEMDEDFYFENANRTVIKENEK